MSIDLTPDVEQLLLQEATRQGTSPQALAAHILELQLPASAASAPLTEKSLDDNQVTLLDVWRNRIEEIEADDAPRAGPTNLSLNSGRRFAELLEEKRRQARQ
jgi:hypothetical protein